MSELTVTSLRKESNTNDNLRIESTGIKTLYEIDHKVTNDLILKSMKMNQAE